MDKKTAETLRQLGLDPDELEAESRRRRANPLDPIRGLLRMFRGGAASALDGVDRWEHDASALYLPFDGTVPVQFVGEMDLDPLDFTIELTREPRDSELLSMTDWIAVVGKDESADDDDHVSNWSEAQAGALDGGGSPTIVWHFDAALASPATVRRLIDRTVGQVELLGLPARRLLVGHTDQLLE